MVISSDRLARAAIARCLSMSQWALDFKQAEMDAQKAAYEAELQHLKAELAGLGSTNPSLKGLQQEVVHVRDELLQAHTQISKLTLHLSGQSTSPCVSLDRRTGPADAEQIAAADTEAVTHVASSEAKSSAARNNPGWSSPSRNVSPLRNADVKAQSATAKAESATHSLLLELAKSQQQLEEMKAQMDAQKAAYEEDVVELKRQLAAAVSSLSTSKLEGD